MVEVGVVVQGPGTERARRRRSRVRIRRIGTLLSIALIACAVVLFTSINVSSDGAKEWIAGQTATQGLLLPLALLVAGVIGLAICLP